MASHDLIRAYIGTYTGERSKGIYLSRFDAETGRLSAPELAAETKNPSFLAVLPNHRCLYAVGEVSRFEGKKSGMVSAFAIDAASGKLSLLNEESSGGTGPCHLAVDGQGKCVLTANYGSGSVAVLPIGADGKLGAPSACIQHQGSSVNPQRQAGPHAHFITADPKDRFALACDLGLDKILVYKLSLGGASGPPGLVPNDPPFAAVKPGSGPRHLAFHPNGRWVYLIDEMGWTLTTLAYDARRGALKELQTVSTVPAGFHGPNLDAEVAVHPSGKFVYASNRGLDSIAVFRVDGKTGELSLLEHCGSGGKTPRHFAIDPAGRWLLAANQDSNNVVVFRLDPKTGHLSPAGQSVEVGSPVCLLFVP
jgi:6-phosphogluconolactonase